MTNKERVKQKYPLATCKRRSYRHNFFTVFSHGDYGWTWFGDTPQKAWADAAARLDRQEK